MRPCSLLAPLGVGLLLGAAAPAAAGTYDVAWDRADLHGRVEAVSQYAAGTYRAVDTPNGVRIEVPPGGTIASGGFAARSIDAPSGSRFVTATALTVACTAAPGMFGVFAASAPVVPLTSHAHVSPTCSSRSATLVVDQPRLSMFLGVTGTNSAAPAYDSSWFELQSLHAALADDVAPSSLALASPSSGGVVGVPEVELAWAAADELSGVATVHVEQDGTIGSEIGGLPAPDVRRATGQRTDGRPGASGAATVALAGPGRHVLRAQVADGAGNVATTASLAVTYVPPPRVLAPPRVTGDARAGSTLGCDPGEWADPSPTLGLTWRRNGTAIAGATTASYVTGVADVGATIDCRVTASNAGTAAGGPPTVAASAGVRVAPAPGASLLAVATIDGRPLDPARATTLAARAAVRIEGELVDGAGIDGRSIVVRVAHPGAPTQAWRVGVGIDGRFSALVRPKRGGTLTARFAGDDHAGPSDRQLAQLRLQYGIEARFTAQRAAGGTLRSLAVSGRVVPAPGIALRLGWQARPRAGTAWQAFCRHGDGIVVRPNGTFTGRCRLPLRLYPTNRYRMVLTPAPLAPYVAGQSPPAAAHVRW